MSAPDGVERDHPLDAPHDGPHGRARRLVRPPRLRGAPGRAARLGRGRGAGGRSGGLRLESPGCGCGIPRTRHEAGRSARHDRAEGRAAALRGRGAAAAGGRPRGACRPDRPRVRGEHPGHGRRRGEDERERLRRRPLAGARMGRRGRRRAASTGACPAELGLRLPQLEPRAPARWWRARPSRWRPRPPEVKATLADMRAARREAQPSGIKTFGSTFKNPDDPRAGGRSAGVLLDEAGCRGLAVGGARFSEKHANFVENTGDGHHGGRGGAHGRGPPAGARALRRDARAGGPDPRRRGRRRRSGKPPTRMSPRGAREGGRRPRAARAAARAARGSRAAALRPSGGARARASAARAAGAPPAPGAAPGRALRCGRLPPLDPRRPVRERGSRDGHRPEHRRRQAGARGARVHRAHHDHPARGAGPARRGRGRLSGGARARDRDRLPARDEHPRGGAPARRHRADRRRAHARGGRRHRARGPAGARPRCRSSAPTAGSRASGWPTRWRSRGARIAGAAPGRAAPRGCARSTATATAATWPAARGPRAGVRRRRATCAPSGWRRPACSPTRTPRAPTYVDLRVPGRPAVGGLGFEVTTPGAARGARPLGPRTARWPAPRRPGVTDRRTRTGGTPWTRRRSRPRRAARHAGDARAGRAGDARGARRRGRRRRGRGAPAP